VHEQLREHAILCGRAGLRGNILRFTPPLCITTADVDYLVDRLDHILEHLPRSG
jgi:4-aminobutyrate aminotransferase-like enzyme